MHEVSDRKTHRSRRTQTLRIALFCLLIFLRSWNSQAQVPSQPFVISERIGDSIDQEERTYFGLFPESDHFLSATAYHHTDTTVVFLISERHDASITETELVVSRQAVDELRRYIHDFENLYETTLKVNWPLLRPVARRVRHLQRGLAITVVKDDGETVAGWLYYVSEQGMVLSKEPAFPDRSVDTTKLIFLRPSEIKHVRDRWSLPKRFFKEVNIPEAGEEGFYQRRVVPVLQQRAAFSSAPSPELSMFLKEALAQQAPPEAKSGSYKYDRGYRRRISNKLHLTLSFRPFAFHPQMDYRVETYDQEPRTRSVFFSQASPVFRLEYSIVRRIRLGLGLHYLSKRPEPALYEGVIKGPSNPLYGDRTQVYNSILNTSGYVQLSGVVADAMLSYAFKPFEEFSFLRERPRSFYSSTEVRIGLGPSLARLSGEVGLSSAYREVLYDEQTGSRERVFMAFNDSDAFEQSTIGCTASVEADFYILSRYFSFGMGAQAFWFPNVRIDPLELPNPIGEDQGAKMLQVVEHTLQYWDTTFRVSLHF